MNTTLVITVIVALASYEVGKVGLKKTYTTIAKFIKKHFGKKKTKAKAKSR